MLTAKNLFAELKSQNVDQPWPTATPPPQSLPTAIAACCKAEWFTHQLWPDWMVEWFLCVDWTCLCCSLSVERHSAGPPGSQPALGWLTLATAHCCQGWSSAAGSHLQITTTTTTPHVLHEGTGLLLLTKFSVCSKDHVYMESSRPLCCTWTCYKCTDVTLRPVSPFACKNSLETGQTCKLQLRQLKFPTATTLISLEIIEINGCGWNCQRS